MNDCFAVGSVRIKLVADLYLFLSRLLPYLIQKTAIALDAAVGHPTKGIGITMVVSHLPFLSLLSVFTRRRPSQTQGQYISL
ncbi:hypothetical protein BDW67DRAFT_157618 [Aspergillus spinulosporus]